MKKSVQEAQRFKVAFDHIKQVLQCELNPLMFIIFDISDMTMINGYQDNDALRISLESSEKIRKHQKELIYMLQKSHSLADTASNLSIASVSTISQRDALSITPSIAAENRQW